MDAKVSGDVIWFKSIVKRDGRIVEFDKSKIVKAIAKAGSATCEFEEGIATLLATKAIALMVATIDKEIPSVEETQDAVEEILIASPYHKTAKAYILYRKQHEDVRDIVNTASIDLMGNYLNRLDWQVNENSNMDYSLQGLNNYVSSEISKVYWLDKIYTNEIRDAQINADFHIHDLNTLSVYCVGWDLADVLMNGFRGAKGKTESSPAKHFRTALGQAANFFYTVQGEAAGAQAFSNFDTLLAPFIRYDGLAYSEVKQAMQEFIFNMNVPTRVGFQTPFTNITLDLNVPSHYADKHVIIGGQPQKAKYGEFQEEMRMFNKAFLEVMLEGDASGRVFTFPIPTYNITKDFDWDDPNLDLLFSVTAKYGIPYFSNFVNSSMNPEDTRSMCCRLRLDTTKLESRGGGLFGANPLTGSIGVVTINMARIGYNTKSEAEFVEKLDRLMDLAMQSLEIKRKVVERFTDADLYPYTKFYLRDIKTRFGEYWKNHFSTIGIVGMNEACMNLLGEKEGTFSAKGREFTLRIMDHMRERLTQFQEETGNNYNLEATPAEGTSYRLAKKDKELYKHIMCGNESAYCEGADPFYTNSTQLPVNHTDDVFEALDLQDEFQAKYTGGTVVHIFVGERITDTKGLKALVKKICNNYKLPYFTITPTFSVCPNHGYNAGEHIRCEKCDAECEVYSRIVGYLRPIRQWNKGKKSEFKERKTYAVGL
ncbi:MAG: ribonucleoside triphosphate reductase [Candidatus Micrarchaeaceae archaeon]|jgi:ribonucleoside-triphosphate reductase